MSVVKSNAVRVARPISEIPDLGKQRMLNAVTRGLSIGRWEALEPHAQLVQLRDDEVLSVCYQQTRHLYFPTTAVCMVTGVHNDTNESVDATLIGNEGFVGMWTLTRKLHESVDSKVKFGGAALRFRASIFEQEFEGNSAFRLSILRYLSAQLRVAAQESHCYRHHSIEQQVAKVLVITQSRVSQAEIHLTHQDIASLLGVRREGVSLATHELVNSGLLGQQRGSILIIDSNGLKKRACDCTEMILHEYSGER